LKVGCEEFSGNVVTCFGARGLADLEVPMEVLVVVVLVALMVAIVAVGIVLMWRRQRSQQLQQEFGPEYERAVRDTGDASSAERDLAGRRKRRSQFDVVPLSHEARARYRDEWKQVEVRFVDEPATAVEEADQLVVRIMRERGYPVDDFDQRADDLSVDHPDVVQHYREAHRVAAAQAQGTADTEQMRQAVTSYRALIDALLSDQNSERSSSSPDSKEKQ
jgi:hypothetical protein